MEIAAPGRMRLATKLRGKPHTGRQAHDQQKIRKAAEEESEEAVDVSGGEPLQAVP